MSCGDHTVFLKGHIILHKRLKILPLLYHVIHRFLAMFEVVPRVPLKLVTEGPKQTIATERETAS